MASETAPPAATSWRMVFVCATGIAILVAAYTGFRLPNTWVVTLDAVSLFDGFHRRFVVGTLLQPVVMATGYNYWVFAAFCYLVLLCVLAVLVAAVIREELISRRLLVIAWLLLPTGGFLIHEVGYFEQVLYLMLFAAIALVHRGHLVIATCLLCVAPFVHEIALVSVIPLFGVVALRTLTMRRALAVTLPPAAINLLVLATSPASEGAVARLEATLRQVNFPVRHDAVALFEHSLTENYELNRAFGTFTEVRAVAIVVIAAFLLLWLLDRTLRDPGPGRRSELIVLAASCAAIAGPVLLVVAGRDTPRWELLIISNFFIVLWICLGDRRRRELGAAAIVTLATTVLVLGHFSIEYLDDCTPRDIGSHFQRRTFLHQLTGKDPSLLTIPKI